MTEREIAEVLRAVPPLYGLWASHPHLGNYVVPDYDAMARAVVERVVPHYPCRAQRMADPPQDCDAPFCGCHPAWADAIQMLLECGWGPCADRNARLARLGEALRQIQREVASDPQNRWCRNALIVADAALADAGAGKERGR